MIFVTLGSQKFQFNRLLRAIDKLIEEGAIKEEVYAQTGYSDYRPNHYRTRSFLDRDEFAEMEDHADIIITHGGTGAIVGAVQKGKKVITIPRLCRYGEHVDDHQIQLIEQFAKSNIICPCYDINTLGECMKIVETKRYRHYVSNTQVILNSIKNYVDIMYGGEV